MELAIQTGLGLIGGLALFLYGMSLLSAAMESLAGTKARNLLARYTRTPWMGVATGSVITVLLDSSSLVIILLIAGVSAGMASLEQAMGIVMGANIGTTLSTQLFALQVEELAPIALAAGFLMQTLGRSERQRTAGGLLLGLGLLFFGLNQMSSATAAWRNDPAVFTYLRRLENPLLGAFAGAVVTAIIQSSSAMMGIVIAMAASGTMTLDAAVALMFGAEIGTCADTLIATWGRPREAVRVGMFHLMFNVASVTLGLAFAGPFISLVRAWTATASLPQQIATAHMLFNCLGVLLFAPWTGPLSRLLRRAVPETEAPAAESYAAQSG